MPAPKKTPGTNPDAQPEPFWQDWEVTSDEDVRRDTYSAQRQRKLKEELEGSERGAENGETSS